MSGAATQPKFVVLWFFSYALAFRQVAGCFGSHFINEGKKVIAND